MTQPTPQSNHDCLEKMAKKFAPDVLERIKTLESLIGGIGEWAELVKKDLEQMKKALYVTTCDRADAISLELAELRGKRECDGEEWRRLAEGKAEDSGELSAIKEAIEEIKGPAMLAVSMELDEGGKKLLYSNKEAREAAMIVALKDDDSYHALLKRKRVVEQRIGHARAVMESLDRDAKEYGRSVDVLTARLNNLTARVA